MLRTVLGVIAIALSLAGLIPYIVSILRRQTVPHIFTWLIWSAMTWIAFLAQISDGGGPGSWVTGVSAVLCIVILLLAIPYGERDVRTLDWISLAVAVAAGGLWALTDSVVTAILLVTLIDAIGFLPTIRKCWHKPESETLLNYYLSAVKHTISIPALTNLSVITVVYPAVVGLMNIATIGVVRFRQSQST